MSSLSVFSGRSFVSHQHLDPGTHPDCPQPSPQSRYHQASKARPLLQALKCSPHWQRSHAAVNAPLLPETHGNSQTNEYLRGELHFQGRCYTG